MHRVDAIIPNWIGIRSLDPERNRAPRDRRSWSGQRLPRSVKENRRLLAIVGPLLDKDSPTPEESALAEVLVTLIHRFEQTITSPSVPGPTKSWPI
jgi:hypothetical protein